MFKYNFEYDKRLTWAHVGCGDHSYRNVLPAYRYCPIDLKTVCDLKPERVEAFARLFGAAEFTTRIEDVLADPEIEVISLVMGVDAEANVVYPELATRCLEAGKHVWIEKPPANSTEEIERLMEAEQQTGKRVACGSKKMFMPSVLRVLQLMRDDRVQQPVQFVGRYPQDVPLPSEHAADPRALIGFRDHICHPASIALRLMGPASHVHYLREETHRGGFVMLRFRSGGVGSIHLANGMAASGLRERTEVIFARGGHVVIENNIDMHWYRPTSHKPYGRDPDFTSDPDSAPVRWRPEFSLGVLYNTGPFLLGYVYELNDFCEGILDDRPFDAAGTEDMLHITRIYDAIRTGEPETWIALP